MDENRNRLGSSLVPTLSGRSNPAEPNNGNPPAPAPRGIPSLAVLGSSVRLGDEQAGIFTVESTGRPTIIETNVSDPESRGSILAQAFSFAAFLKGSTVRSLESEALKKHLKDRGYRSIREAAQAQTSPEAVDETFGTSLQRFLNRGDFRFVMVLDEVPERLERITAYLDEMTE